MGTNTTAVFGQQRAAHLLTKAATIVDRNGLAPDTWIDPETDDHGNWRPDEECPVCPRAAIALAAGKHPEYMSEQLWTEGGSPWERDPVAAQEITDAEMVLVAYLLDDLGWTPRTREALRSPLLIEAWAEESTRPQVVGAMRAAALGAARGNS